MFFLLGDKKKQKRRGSALAGGATIVAKAGDLDTSRMETGRSGENWSVGTST